MKANINETLKKKMRNSQTSLTHKRKDKLYHLGEVPAEGEDRQGTPDGARPDTADFSDKMRYM